MLNKVNRLLSVQNNYILNQLMLIILVISRGVIHIAGMLYPSMQFCRAKNFELNHVFLVLLCFDLINKMMQKDVSLLIVAKLSC